MPWSKAAPGHAIAVREDCLYVLWGDLPTRTATQTASTIITEVIVAWLWIEAKCWRWIAGPGTN